MAEIFLNNVLTRKKEKFTPITSGQVGIYTCGPTVYDYAHIGHARTYIFADILQRTLEYNALVVKRVMNITDVGHLTSDSDTGEDKMEKGAEREKKTVWEIADFYTKDFFDMIEALNIKKPEIVPKATDHIKEMIELIKTLEEKGFTYKLADGIYFDTSKFPKYGELTGQTWEDMQKNLRAGARVEMVPGKKHPTDFALWKFSPIGEKRQMEWESPWGKGFPGWHIECSAMSMKYLGESFDIHTGGVDHIPVHHTNEIAQSEASSGKQFVRFWLEGEHLLVENEKMSKSLGNFYRLADLEAKGVDPLAFRYLVLTAHYSTRLNFTWEALKAAETALKNLYREVSGYQGEARIGCAEFESRFLEAINDDLDTPKALAIVWELVKSDYPDSAKLKSLLKFDQVLGLDLENQARIKVSAEVENLVSEREKARKDKDFVKSDEIRKQIAEIGYEVIDDPAGPKLKKII
ncbi:MAG TPA: cysteine--tRNA ligase [Candidatus Nanoarchaeia archaeon]|nr:cysteine--tRNA ligase [uncultured archaeon]